MVPTVGVGTSQWSVRHSHGVHNRQIFFQWWKSQPNVIKVIISINKLLLLLVYLIWDWMDLSQTSIHQKTNRPVNNVNFYVIILMKTRFHSISLLGQGLLSVSVQSSAQCTGNKRDSVVMVHSNMININMQYMNCVQFLNVYNSSTSDSIVYSCNEFQSDAVWNFLPSKFRKCSWQQ